MASDGAGATVREVTSATDGLVDGGGCCPGDDGLEVAEELMIVESSDTRLVGLRILPGRSRRL
jgi:hypothetical protein